MANYRILPPNPSPRDISEIVNSLRAGHINSVGTVSFTANTTGTTLTDPNIHSASTLHLMPLSRPAAQEAWWAISRTKGSMVIGHNTLSATDRAYAYAVIG